MNEARLMGRLGQDPEFKFTPAGNAVCNFSVATVKKWKGKDGTKQEKTEWHRCVAWNKTAEVINEYFSKGDGILVKGELETRKWQDKTEVTHYTTEIIVNGFEFPVGSRTDRPTNTELKKEAGTLNESLKKDYGVEVDTKFTASDIPF